MSKSEDSISPTYPYAWSTSSDLILEDFLTKYKPSMVQNDGTKPWIWVRKSQLPIEDEVRDEEAIEEASKLLKEVTDTVESIKNDATIPMRSNKKTGAKSKKEVREQVQSEATEKLKEIAIKKHYVAGKWLIFAAAEKVDMIWSNLAASLVSGPLSLTSAYLAKVATSPAEENPNYQHLICLYIPNVYDRDDVMKVMRVLLRNHGVNLSGVKSDLYTAIGIDSKHGSGIPSTIWKSSALLSDTEAKELKDKFFAEISSNSKAAVVQVAAKDTVNDNAPTTSTKMKPKLKKKVDDDPFASDDNADQEEDNQRKEEIQSKKAFTKPKREKDDDDDDESRPRKKTTKRG